MPETFWTPELVGHFFAGLQFMLGDLDADTDAEPQGRRRQRVVVAGSVRRRQRRRSPAGACASHRPRRRSPRSLDVPNGGSLTTIRVGAADNNMWFGWRVGLPDRRSARLTFSEALAKADVMSITTRRGLQSRDGQRRESRSGWTTACRRASAAAIVYRLRELNLQPLSYRVETLPARRGDATPGLRVCQVDQSRR